MTKLEELVLAVESAGAAVEKAKDKQREAAHRLHALLDWISDAEMENMEAEDELVKDVEWLEKANKELHDYVKETP